MSAMMSLIVATSVCFVPVAGWIVYMIVKDKKNQSVDDISIDDVQ
jgi:hypothetical protein